jgi:hypothetical protein
MTSGTLVVVTFATGSRSFRSSWSGCGRRPCRPAAPRALVHVPHDSDAALVEGDEVATAGIELCDVEAESTWQAGDVVLRLGQGGRAEIPASRKARWRLATMPQHRCRADARWRAGRLAAVRSPGPVATDRSQPISISAPRAGSWPAGGWSSLPGASPTPAAPTPRAAPHRGRLGPRRRTPRRPDGQRHWARLIPRSTDPATDRIRQWPVSTVRAPPAPEGA